jgi:serine/threonine protein kinase
MRRSYGLIGAAHLGSVATPFPSRACYPAIMKRSFSTRLFRTLRRGRPTCALAPTQRLLLPPIPECFPHCFIHVAPPTPPATCLSSASIRLGSIRKPITAEGQTGLPSNGCPYKIEHRIGAKGMGEVLRAIDTRLGRAVALKTCREKFSERFRREAPTIASLNHPHICSIYDVGPTIW